MSKTMEERLGHLEDAHAIQQLRATYCQVLDDQDWDARVQTFTADGAFIGLSTARGHEELKTFFSRLTAGAIDSWWHFSSNETVDIKGDEATGSTWLWQPCVVEGKSQIAAGRYVDHMVRCTDGQWRFQERKVTFFWWVDETRGWSPGRFDFAPAANARDEGFRAPEKTDP